MEKLQDQIKALTTAEWDVLLGWMVNEEKNRRLALPAVERGQADLVAELQESGKLEKPEAVDADQATEKPDKIPAWVNPLTDHAKMYHAGAVVTHNGKVWESTHPGLNHWEPGAHGVDSRIWLDITYRVHPPAEPDENVAGGVVPFGPGLPVKVGDIVEYKGARYKVLSDHTTQEYWPPNEAHSLFQKL